MRTLVAYLPALACGVMMLFICVPMLLGRKHNQSADQGASQQEVAELREEISRLKAERALDNKSEAFDG
ncbi:MAG TPA: hypothetical protein VFF07_07820 [Actinomycetota bacterium]|nr:hypothetical protein [Actinomycetota bacterium]